MTPEEALTSGFGQWLEHVAGNQRPLHAVSPGQDIAPFGTSMRRTNKNSEWLNAIDAGQPLAGARPEQKIIDLRAAGLLLDGSPARLSFLGRTVLAEWERLGVANDDDKYEVVRSAALHRSGLLLAGHEVYRGHMRFWMLLRRLRRPEDWFNDKGNLVLATYLNRTDPSGYNPFLVLAGLGAGFPSFVEWQRWANRLPVPNGWQVSRLAYVLSRVDAPRAGGLVAYCKGMEAVYLAAVDPRTLPAAALTLAVAA